MGHWATATGVIDRKSPGPQRLRTTALGQRLFADGGLDPYMEAPATAWLLHWQVAGRPDKTTWFWAFSYFPALAFERELLVNGVAKLAAEREWTRTFPPQLFAATCPALFELTCRNRCRGRPTMKMRSNRR